MITKTQFHVINSNGNIIKTYFCDTLEQASAKVKFNFPNTYMFLKLQKGIKVKLPDHK